MAAAELRRSRVSAAGAFGLQGLVFASIVTQAPRVQDRLGLDEADLTVVLVLVAVVSGVGSAAAGAIAARRTSADALRVALLLIGLGALLVGLAPTWPLLLAAFAVYGLGVGGVDAGMNMQGVRVQAAYGRSIMAGLHGTWSVGGITGALYASACAALDVPVAASLVIVALAAWAGVAWLAPGFVRERVEEVSLSGEGLHVPWRPVLVLGLVILVFYAVDTGTLTWCSPYLDEALDAPASVVPLGYAGYQAGALVSRFCADVLVRRRGARAVVLGGTVVGFLGLVVVVAAPVPVLAIAGFVVVGAGLAVLAPLSFAALGEQVGGSALDVAIARMNVANYLGAILGGGVVGAAASAGHLRWAFVVPLVAVPTVLLGLRAFRRA